jgi:PAS domain S-box-containing protein
MTDKNLKNIFDTIEDFLFVIDLEGNIIDFNSTAEQTLGYSSGELLSMKAVEIHPYEYRKRAGDIIIDIIDGKTNICPLPLMKKCGKIIPVETKVSKGKWNNRDVFFGISRNFTEREAIEKELRLYRENLEKLVKEKTEKLEITNKNLIFEIEEKKKIEEKLIESLEAQRELSKHLHMAAIGEVAADVAHEVNNPINGIINCAEMIMDISQDNMVKDIAGKIIIAGEHIADKIKSLFSFSKKDDKNYFL